MERNTGLNCSATGSREHLKYLRNVIVLQEKRQSGVRKLNHKQELGDL